jgi:hypothetical protein
MDLNKLFDTMRNKGFYYADVLMNKTGYIRFSFCSEYNGRGNHLEVDTDMDDKTIDDIINSL